jgi:hypothetical protein
VYNSIRYLDNITSMEEELGVIYDEAFIVVREASNALTDDANRQYHMEARDSSRD